MFTTTYNTIREFIFGGNSGEAGIGCITGDAGVDNSAKLSLSDFCDIVHSTLADSDYIENIDELRTEFADDKDALYAEYVEFYETSVVAA